MSLIDLRTALSTAARHGAPDVAAFAQDMLSLLAEPEKSAARTREWRRHKASQPVTGASQPVTPDVTSRHAVTAGDAPVTGCDGAGGRGALSGSLSLLGSPALSGSPEPQRESARAARPTKSGQKTKIPDPESGELAAWAKRWGIDLDHPRAGRFVDHFLSEDKGKVRWDAAWRVWCSRPDFGPPMASPGWGKPEPKPSYTPPPVSARNPNRLPQPHELVKPGTLKAPDLGPGPAMPRAAPPPYPARALRPEMTQEQREAERQRQLALAGSMNGDGRGATG